VAKGLSKTLIALLSESPENEKKGGVMQQLSNEQVLSILMDEVPEIKNGEVEIKGLARIPGVRSKIAIITKSAAIDAMAACVGAKACRLHRISQRLLGERIEIVHWEDDPSRLIVNALVPAKIQRVILRGANSKASVVVLEDDAILVSGPRGSQNVDLATRLTGWQIDVIVE
jgi:transcription termination/antitermination protein NusA